MTNGIRSVEQGFHSMMRRIHNLERRIGSPELAAAEIINRVQAGSGPFCYDYLVASGWDGAQGREVTDIGGFTFKIYSTIGGAIADANLRNESGRIYSIGVCPGTYTEQISWPSTTAGQTYSGLLIEGLGQKDDHNDLAQVVWRTQFAGQSPIELDSANALSMQIENIVFSSPAGTPNIDWSAGVNLDGHMRNCAFNSTVEMNTAVFWFLHCRFLTNAHFVGQDDDDLFFINCEFIGNLDLSNSNTEGLQVINCDFVGGDIKLGEASAFYIANNNFSGNISDSDRIVLQSRGAFDVVNRGVIIGNVFESQPSTGDTIINIDGLLGSVWNIQIIGNVFTGVFTTARDANTAWIKIAGDAGDKVFGIVVAHNSFGANDAQGDTIEDAGGFTVIGDHVERSVFGPNVLNGKVQYNITNGANNLIIPTSADANPSGSGQSESITRLQSATFTIDSTGVKTITTAHGLGVTPSIEDVQLTVHEETDVDDWGFDLLKVDSVDATNVVAKINVSTASATGGALARLGILVAT